MRSGRSSSVESHACLSITPSVRARFGFRPAGMLNARTFPDSIRSESAGRHGGRPTAVPPSSSSGHGGANFRPTSGRSKTARNTASPVTTFVRVCSASPCHSCVYQRVTASCVANCLTLRCFCASRPSPHGIPL